MNAAAAKGLHDSARCYLRFWKKTRLRTDAAERALDQVDALHDRDASHAAALARSAAGALSDPRARLAALRAGLDLIQAGAASGICGMAGMATTILSRVPRDACGRAMLDTVVKTASAEHAPESAFAQMLGHLGSAGAASRAELQRLSRGVPADARGFAAAAAEMRAGPVDACLPDLRAVAQASQDSAALAVLDRVDALRKLPVSGEVKSALASAGVATIAAGSPGGPLLTAKLAQAAIRSASASDGDRDALAAAALADVAKGPYAAGSPISAWLSFSGQVDGIVGGSGVRSGVLEALASEQPATVPNRAGILARHMAKLDPAHARKLFDLLGAADQHEGFKWAEYLAAFRELEQRVGGSDALQVSLLAEGVQALGASQADASSPALVQAALAGVALRLGSGADAAAARALGDAILSEVEAHAGPHPDATTADMLAALKRVLALPQAEDRYVVSTFKETMRQLQKPPADVAGWARAIGQVVGAPGYWLDRQHAARALVPALASAADRGSDATQKAKCRLLAGVADHDLYDVESQTRSLMVGLEDVARPTRASGSALAAFGLKLCNPLRYYVDRVQVASDVAAAIQSQAVGAGNAGLEDEADLLQRVAAIPNPEEQYQAAALTAGLDALSRGEKYRGDAFVGFAAQVLRAAHYYQPQAAVADAAAQVMQARARTGSLADRDVQCRFLHEVAAMPFADQNSRAAAMAAGLDAAANGRGTQEEGLAQVALAVVKNAKYARDRIHVAEQALAEVHQMAEHSGELERLDLIKTYEQAASLQNYEDQYQVQVAELALDGVARRPVVDPGELAGTGLKMIGQAYYLVSALQVGDVILRGLEALAADEKDTVYVPALVADIRQKMAAAGSDPRARLKALQDGLQEIARLRGDAFRKALIAALKKENPSQQPGIVEGDGYVEIGGIRVPKAKL